jgi:uncharacterized membrane protein YheB (UPF0754 family)
MTLDQLQKRLQKDDKELDNAWRAVSDDMNRLLEENHSHHKILTVKMQLNIAEAGLQAIRNRIEASYTELFQKPLLIQHYFECLSEPTWYLHTEELGIIAHLFK